MARKLPTWIVIVAFAALVGATIGGLAYFRGRVAPSYCITKLADKELAVVERRDRFCKTSAPALTIVRQRADYMTQLRALEQQTQLASETIATDPGQQAAILETTVQATKAVRVGIFGWRGDVIELHFDPAVFDKEKALAAMRELVK